MINVAKLAKSAINMSSPYLPVTLKLYIGQENQYGKMVSSYSYFDIKSQIQSTNRKELKDVNGISLSDTFLTFYFVKADLSTVDRVIQKGTDFIIYNAITYKIVRVQDSFNTEWTSVIACEYKEGI